TERAPSRLALDPLHVVVAEAEMVADLVDEHVADDGVEVLAGLAPIIENGPAIEKDHLRVDARIVDALMRQCHAAIEAEDVEGALEPHLALGLLVGKFHDADDSAAEMALEALRDGGERALGQGFEIAHGGRRGKAAHRRHRPALISRARSATSSTKASEG